MKQIERLRMAILDKHFIVPCLICYVLTESFEYWGSIDSKIFEPLGNLMDIL